MKELQNAWNWSALTDLWPDFVCVKVLQPSQPSGVMSNVVSLPTCNHTFNGQA